MASNNPGQVFAAGALAGAAVAAAATYYYCSSSTKTPTVRQVNQQQQQQPAILQQQTPAHHASLQEFDQDEVLAEQLTRNVQFFGLDNQKGITKSFVVVIGLGVRSNKASVQQHKRQC
jgi:glutamate-1-semialdehyde aminotransferase